MAAAVDVTIVKDGGQQNGRLHPYLVSLVRWCISCIWSSATLLLHRLMTKASLPAITASKVPSKPPPKPRPASKEHLHPEPIVECVVLHEPPADANLDVIFVHGLYDLPEIKIYGWQADNDDDDEQIRCVSNDFKCEVEINGCQCEDNWSLGNTWRQGDWRSKYKLDPNKVTLRNHPTHPCDCNIRNEKNFSNTESELNDNITFDDITERMFRILANEDCLTTEQFYNKNLVNQTEVLDNYETQAKFVEDLFRSENKNCDSNNCDLSNEQFNDKSEVNDVEFNYESVSNDFKCEVEINRCECEDDCKSGCGCVCDDCYSNCWPKDWIKEDFPGARVISINYTSDPYLWRPLWVKQSKRLRLHERAEQMIEQLLALGVGQRPIVWVGHSKGGLFIKQIYCEAYEAYTEMEKIKSNVVNVKLNTNDQHGIENNLNISSKMERDGYTVEYENEFINDKCNYNIINNSPRAEMTVNSNDREQDFNLISNVNNDSSSAMVNSEILSQNSEDMINIDNNSNVINNERNRNDSYVQEVRKDDILRKISVVNDEKTTRRSEMNDENDKMTPSDGEMNDRNMSSICREDTKALVAKSSLWVNSAGFMFYSVPHRGSPLADIKTPITTRSIELLEIAKDCPLVLGLQERWVAAAAESRAAVRSLVETGRTLMSVLWLRIVSVDSADAGIGPLHGVPVDHREICKPASRACPLYTELTDLIRNALNKCDCQ